MKNIAILINSLGDGGAEKFVLELSKQLNGSNICLIIICLEKKVYYTINEEIDIVYLNDKDAGGALRKLLMLFSLGFKLGALIRRKNIAIVQSHLYRSNYVNIISKLLFTNHLCQVVNHSVTGDFYKKEGLSGKINLFLVRFLYSYADKIINVSRAVEQDLNKINLFKVESEVIYNGFDIKKILKKSILHIGDFEFRHNVQYIVSVGRLVKLKRHKDLLTVLSFLDNNVELVIIGEGEERGNLENYANELNIEQRVNFIGWKDNPYKYISKCDVLVNSSESESFGNVIIEAMACRTGVVSTRSGGPEELIEDKSDGLLVDIGDIEGFLSAISLFLNNKRESERMINRAYAKVCMFDLSITVKNYKRVLGVES